VRPELAGVRAGLAGQPACVLEVAITPDRGHRGFRVEVISSPAGEASAVSRLDAHDWLARRGELEEAVLMSALAAGQASPDAGRLVRQAGQELFSALLGAGDVALRHSASLAVAAGRGQNLRVVLRVGDPVLAGLPWEAMYDPGTDSYVCRLGELVRHVAVPSVSAPLAVEPPLRILGITSSPRGLPPLQEAREKRLLEEAMAGVGAAAAQVAWAPSATWADLQNVLLEGRWHVIHFIGHGDFDPGCGEGVLALAGRHGYPDLIEASRLTDLLRQARPMPRLVVLNACSGAVSAAADLFSGTAAALVRGGVSAVVAMQYGISDQASLAFTRGFYGAIARGRGVDEAVSSGRVAIIGLHRRTLEWITPVLYLRERDGRLFTMPAVPSPAPATPAAGPAPRAAGRDPFRIARTMAGHTAAVHCVAFSPDGTLLASAGLDRMIRLGRVADGTTVRTISWPAGPVHSVAFSPDGATLASAGAGGRALRLWDTASGSPRGRVAGDTAGTRWVAFSPDGGLLASAGSDQTVRIWDAASGAALRTLTGHTAAVRCVAFSPDGGLLASAGSDQTVRIWDAASGAALRTLTGHVHAVTSVAFAPGGNVLASAGGDKTVRLWDPVSGAAAGMLRGHAEPVYSVAFSPDGSLLASAGGDRTVRLWQAGSWTPGGALGGHAGTVQCVAFSPDGGLLASAGSDHQVQLWSRGR
jgi:hypothetical protein